MAKQSSVKIRRRCCRPLPRKRFSRRSARVASRERVGSTHKDDAAAQHVVDGEHPEAEPVDDHRDELPVARHCSVLGVVFQLARHPAQFVQYGQQLVTKASERRRQNNGRRRRTAVSAATASQRAFSQRRRVLYANKQCDNNNNLKSQQHVSYEFIWIRRTCMSAGRKLKVGGRGGGHTPGAKL